MMSFWLERAFGGGGKGLAKLLPVERARPLTAPPTGQIPPTGVIWKNYIIAGGQRVAVREYTATGGTVYFLLGDHLGSLSVVADSNGNLVGQIRYTAFGEQRLLTGEAKTDYRYTGQLSEVASIGLYFYQARFFDPVSAHFASADSIVPGAGNPMAWDRYAYVMWNSMRFKDPSGHVASCEENCAEQRRLDKLSAEVIWKGLIKSEFGITMSDEGDKKWDNANLYLMFQSLDIIDKVLQGNLRSMVLGATFKLMNHGPEGGDYYGSTHIQEPTGIDFYTKGTQFLRQMNIFHEVGHLLDNVPGTWNAFTKAVRSENNPTWVLNDVINLNALISDPIHNDPHYDAVEARQTYSGQGESEQWADAFANYVAGNIKLSDAQGPGATMYAFVNETLNRYVSWFDLP